MAELGWGARNPALLELAIATPAIVLTGTSFLLPMVTDGPSALPRAGTASATIFFSLRVLGPSLVSALDRDGPEASSLSLSPVGLGSAVTAAVLTGLPLPVGAFAAGLALG